MPRTDQRFSGGFLRIVSARNLYKRVCLLAVRSCSGRFPLLLLLALHSAAAVEAAAVWQQSGSGASVTEAPENGANDADREALWNAARTGDLEQVRQLLEAGVPVDAATPYGSTALCFACDRGHLEVVQLLLEKGANPEVSDNFYHATPLSWAVSSSHYPVVTALLAAGASGADTQLYSAIEAGDAELAKAVLASEKIDDRTMSIAQRLVKALEKKDLESLFPAADSAPVPDYVPAAAELAGLAGRFTASDDEMTLEFGESEGKLQLFPGQPYASSLTPLAEGEFWSSSGRLVFSVSDGKAVSVTLHAALGPMVFQRAVESEKPEEEAAGEEAKESEAAGADAADTPPAAKPWTANPDDLAVSSANWPGFRGTGSRGVADGQHPPVEWSVETGSNILWKTPLPGLGFSCPTIWGDCLYLTSAVSAEADNDVRIGLYGDVNSVEDDSVHDFVVFCLNRQTGEVIWQKTLHTARPAVKRHSKSSHANPTVATDGRYLVAFFGSEGLYCLDMQGELVWKKDLGLLDSGWFLDPGYQWGFGSSPVIHEGSVILQCDIQKGSFVASFDLATGRENWRTPREEIPTWPTPVVHRFGDLPMLITHGTRAARGYDARDGQLLWSVPGHSEIVTPTPVVAHDLIYVASGYSPVQPIVAIRPAARGEIRIPGSRLEDGTKVPDEHPQIAWSTLRGGPYMPSPIAYGDYLYICSNSGVLTCHDALTGKQVYKQRIKGGGTLAFTASPVAADGHLYLTSEDGRVYVVAAGSQFRQVSVNPLGDSALATPAIADGIFYGRTVSGLVACQSGAQSEPVPADGDKSDDPEAAGDKSEEKTGEESGEKPDEKSDEKSDGKSGSDGDGADGESDAGLSSEPVSAAAASDGPGRLTDDQKSALREVFIAVHDGYSADEVVLDDALQEKFLAACSEALPGVSAETCNWGLLNLRKAGKLKDVETTRQKQVELSTVRSLAEIVTRQVQDRHSVTADQIMTIPELRSEFNAAVRQLDPAADPYAVRKAAFQLRKTRQLKPELITRIADWGRQVTVRSAGEWRADPDSIPESAGIYLFSDPSGYLYIGESDNLRRRLVSHLDESDRQSLAAYLAKEGVENISIEIQTFAEGSRINELSVRRAYESELIRSRNPRFNIRP